MSYDLAPRPPPSPFSRQHSTGDTQEEKDKQLADGRAMGRGGKEPNYTPQEGLVLYKLFCTLCLSPFQSHVNSEVRVIVGSRNGFIYILIHNVKPVPPNSLPLPLFPRLP